MNQETYSKKLKVYSSQFIVVLDMSVTTFDNIPMYHE